VLPQTRRATLNVIAVEAVIRFCKTAGCPPNDRLAYRGFWRRLDACMLAHAARPAAVTESCLSRAKALQELQGIYLNAPALHNGVFGATLRRKVETRARGLRNRQNFSFPASITVLAIVTPSLNGRCLAQRLDGRTRRHRNTYCWTCAPTTQAELQRLSFVCFGVFFIVF